MDELCKAAGQKKPRMYRKRARKDYLRLPKSKKRSGKAIRSAIRKQLQYIRRDIRYIAELVQKGAELSSKQADRLNIITTVYEQQRLMFESGTHSIPRRIVSLAQPWVRPIVRGKTHTNTEFGSKLHISLVDGYARIERLDFEPFNESEDLPVSGALWLLSGTHSGGQDLLQPPDTGFLQRAWHSSVRSGSRKAAKSSRPVPSSEETGVSGQLRPQCRGGCFRDGQDRLRPGPRHGTPTGNRCLCDWRCTAALKPFLIPEGRSCSVLPHTSAVCFAEVAEQSLRRKI